jgi:hypothetical protein
VPNIIDNAVEQRTKELEPLSLSPYGFLVFFFKPPCNVLVSPFTQMASHKHIYWLELVHFDEERLETLRVLLLGEMMAFSACLGKNVSLFDESCDDDESC